MSIDIVEAVDGAYVASAIVMLRLSEPEKTYLLVEGRDDDLLFSRLVNRIACEPFNCFGKENLVPAIHILNSKSDIEGYLGIKDSDFDVIEKEIVPQNIVLTDGHDLETMVLASNALSHLIDVRVGNEVREVREKFKTVIRTRLFEIGSMIGYLRLISQRYGWGIKIHTLQLLNSLDIKEPLILQDVIDSLRSMYPDLDHSKFSEQEYKELADSHLHHLCQGHETVSILGYIFGIISKNELKRKVNAGNDLSERVFLAYDFRLFQQTDLFQQIKSWEKDNIPFLIVSDN